MRKKVTVLASLCLLFCFQAFLQESAAWAKEDSSKIAKKVRIAWASSMDAVGYELVVSKDKDDKKKNIIVHKDGISTPGVELDASGLDLKKGKYYWKVRPTDIHQRPIGEFTEAKSLEEAEINPEAPMVTTQFDRFPLAKMYPVYSWIPVKDAAYYDIQVYFDEDKNPLTPDKLIMIKKIEGGSSFDYYDDNAYREPGTYWWRIRADGKGGMPISKWSEPTFFHVKAAGGEIAALGDSITHGGGAVSVPPSDPNYDWQSYTGLVIRNLGFSGNTVGAMSSRFNEDVLAFKPKILVVLGGINDLRGGTKATEVINGLNHIKYKCIFNDITPVFVTVPPVNPAAMKVVFNNPPADSWIAEQKIVNEWIKSQRHYVDVAKNLTDQKGWLIAELSVDGLHPDSKGKRIIGENIGEYLKRNFTWVANKEKANDTMEVINFKFTK